MVCERSFGAESVKTLEVSNTMNNPDRLQAFERLRGRFLSDRYLPGRESPVDEVYVTPRLERDFMATVSALRSDMVPLYKERGELEEKLRRVSLEIEKRERAVSFYIENAAPKPQPIPVMYEGSVVNVVDIDWSTDVLDEDSCRSLVLVLEDDRRVDLANRDMISAIPVQKE